MRLRCDKHDNTLHLELDDCIINVRVNLHDRHGRKVTSIEILPDQGKLYYPSRFNNRIITKSGG